MYFKKSTAHTSTRKIQQRTKKATPRCPFSNFWWLRWWLRSRSFTESKLFSRFLRLIWLLIQLNKHDFKFQIVTRFQQNKLLSAQKISSRQVSNYFQIDKILFLTRCKANYFWHKRQAPDKFQIIYKISNWIPDKIQSRLLSAQKKVLDKFQDFQILLFKIPSTIQSYRDYCSNRQSHCSFTWSWDHCLNVWITVQTTLITVQLPNHKVTVQITVVTVQLPDHEVTVQVTV